MQFKQMGIQMVSIEKEKSVEMEGTSHGEIFHHVITIMEDKINQPPRRLSENAGNEFCCIFRVPESFVGINKKAYQPHIVSIGPYHYGKDHLEMMQEHKWRFLGSFLRRTRRHNVDLVRLFRAVEQMEERIRECYSEMIEIDKNSLVKMMVLDGCFVVELFCIVGGLSDTNIDDPIFNMQWILTFIMRDLLRLENQIPFFVLETLFKLSISGSDRKNVRSLTQLSLEFFNYMVQRPVEVIENHANLIGKHLLDLFRMSFLPSSSQVTPRNRTTSSSGELSRNTSSTERTSTISTCLSEETSKMSTSSTEEPSTFLQLIPSAKKLHLAGIQFKPGKSDSFLDVKFNNGVLQIPLLTIDDFSSSVFLNCVAFEQCYHYITNHVTTYATFMGCLINTPSDAGFLCDHKIIENYFGTDEEIARFFNNIRKDVAFDIEKSYLTKLFEDVNEYYRNDWHVRWAGFKHTYFDTPWSFMSAMAALILLILTLIQAFFGFKHLVIVKFKEDVVVEDILKGMQKLVSEIDAVKSFEWGQDIEGEEMLGQGFTHAFLMTFEDKQGYTAFVGHPCHVEFSATFSTAIDKIVLLDFPSVVVKAAT